MGQIKNQYEINMKMKLFVNTFFNIFDLVLNNQHWKLLNSLTIGVVFISHPHCLYEVGHRTYFL